MGRIAETIMGTSRGKGESKTTGAGGSTGVTGTTGTAGSIGSIDTTGTGSPEAKGAL